MASVIASNSSPNALRQLKIFATAEFSVAFFYWLFVPIMLVIIGHDAKRMLIDPIPPAGA